MVPTFRIANDFVSLIFVIRYLPTLSIGVFNLLKRGSHFVSVYVVNFCRVISFNWQDGRVGLRRQVKVHLNSITVLSFLIYIVGVGSNPTLVISFCF